MRLSIPDFSRTRILVVGDLMLDRYWVGPASRISPEAPVPVVKIGSIEERPGGAGNVALNIAALGGQVTVLGLTGDDEQATSLADGLECHGVECRFLRVAGNKTVTKLRVLSHHQQLIRLDFEDGFSSCDYKVLEASYLAALKEADLVIVSDYGKGTLQEVSSLILQARDSGHAVVVDPKGTDFDRYRNATAITPNINEFEAVVGSCRDEEEMVTRGQSLCSHLGLSALLITRSDKGMTLMEQGCPPLHLPTHARDVYDVTGAGDTVIAVLGAGLAIGLSMPQATELANLAAGVVVGKLGTAVASIPELQAAMLKHEPLHRGVVSEQKLLSLVKKARISGERIIMTNGCFDILHTGHVQYLEQAAQLGNRLIVAVNDDASVRRLKGNGRPINPLQQRMAVLAGLAAVDWVVPFSEDTPERLICGLKPDCLVKGGDYWSEDVAGHQCAGQTRILPYVDGCSTSNVIHFIKTSDDFR